MFFHSARRMTGHEDSEDLGVEEGFLDARPAGRGDDDVAEHAENDDGADDGDEDAPGRSRPSSRDLAAAQQLGGVVGATPLMRLPVAQRLLEERHFLAGVDPLVEDLLMGSVGDDRGDRLVDAVDQRDCRARARTPT